MEIHLDQKPWLHCFITIILDINFNPCSFDFLNYWIKFGQAKQCSKPLIEINFKSFITSFQRLIDVWEELIRGHTMHTILVIPHSILGLNRNLKYLNNILGPQSHLLCCFSVRPSAIIKGCYNKFLKNRLMKSTILFVLGTWKTLPTTFFSFCSIKPLMKIFWQSWLLGKALHPLSNSIIFSQLIRV